MRRATKRTERARTERAAPHGTPTSAFSPRDEAAVAAEVTRLVTALLWGPPRQRRPAPSSR
jgi:hypothetical protein